MTEKPRKWRQITIRIEPEKMKRLKILLVEKELTAQQWLAGIIDSYLAVRKP